MLNKIIAYLAQRFPPKLEVSVQDYTMLREEVAQLNRAAQGVIELNLRLVTLESQVQRLNNANGFVNVKKGELTLER